MRISDARHRRPACFGPRYIDLAWPFDSRKSGSNSAGQPRESSGRFGAKSALDYLIREKLLNFAQEAERQPEFARELPRFLAEVWQIFNEYEIAGYVASLKPNQRKTVRNLLYLR
jgi:hypothetical protein